ncbi:hypothetical protein BDP27DRAFT_1435522 [Rhodocollybia butyracea]|uniref:Uncharacterized protein n=1 Tax=Rhodocollybia butyracea TaxID=206335 RepID=A0A9P5P581_9AGAR|nr:hypothetical protein BDP27DRAFT_1435522 [Rhodocollybia butyracea]
MHPRVPSILLLVLFLHVTAVRLQAVNRSIDDTFGDSVTGQRPVFLPTSPGVWANQDCTGCAIQPPTTKAFDGTYTASTYNSMLGSISIAFNFTGTAVYVFFILANIPASLATATTAANFTLDGALVGNFTHAPDLSLPDFQFNENALAFSTSGLENATHQMVISTSGLDEHIFVNFDYALYTFEDAVAAEPRISQASTSTSTSPTGAIVGGVIGGLATLGASVAILLFCHRRSRRSGPQPSDGTKHEHPDSFVVQHMGSKTNVPRGRVPSRKLRSTVGASPLGASYRDSQYTVSTVSTLTGDDCSRQHRKWSTPDTSIPDLQYLWQKELEHQIWVINEKIEQLRSKAKEPSGFSHSTTSAGLTGEKADSVNYGGTGLEQ